MRRLFIVVIVVLLAAAGLVALIEMDSGYVLISYRFVTIETSLWMALFLLLAFYYLFYLLMRVLRRLSRMRGAVGDWLGAKTYRRELVQLEMKLAAGECGEVVRAFGERGAGELEAAELRLLVRARRGLGDWPELLTLLPWLHKRRVLDAEEMEALEFQVHTGMLAAAHDVKQAWNGIPAEQRKRSALIEYYGNLLLEAGDDLEAEKVLTKAIKRDWDGRLVAMYGRIRGRDPARRLKQAESWLKSHPEDAGLMLCLGRLSLRNDLWGQARDYFETSHRLAPSSETCAELGRLLFSLGEREKSARYYREGLLLRETNLPDLPLPARDRPRSVRGR